MVLGVQNVFFHRSFQTNRPSNDFRSDCELQLRMRWIKWVSKIWIPCWYPPVPRLICRHFFCCFCLMFWWPGLDFSRFAFREKSRWKFTNSERRCNITRFTRRDPAWGTYRTCSTLPGSSGGYLVGLVYLKWRNPHLCKSYVRVSPIPKKASFKVLSLPPCLVLLDFCGEFMYTPEI